MRSVLKQIIQVSVASLVLLLALESAGRVIRSFRDDVRAIRTPSPDSEWYQVSPDFGWERRAGFKGMYRRADADYDERGFLRLDSDQVNDPGPGKVLFIGDSNTNGFDIPATNTFAQQIESMVPGLKSVNVALYGYTSYQGRKSLEKYLPLVKPSAVVVSYNFNDRRGVPQGQEDGGERFLQAYKNVNNPMGSVYRGLRYLYSYRAMRKGLESLHLVQKAVDVKSLPVDALRPRVDEDHYRENLSAMVEQAQRAGIPIVFILLRDSPLVVGHLNRGIEATERGDYQDAVEHLTIGNVGGGGFMDDVRRIYLARTYQAMGKADLAESTLRGGERMDSYYGGYLIRRDRDYNKIMLEVAARYGVTVVDGATSLEMDPYVFLDECHFNSAGHRIVAELLAPVLSKIVTADSPFLASEVSRSR